MPRRILASAGPPHGPSWHQASTVSALSLQPGPQVTKELLLAKGACALAPRLAGRLVGRVRALCHLSDGLQQCHLPLLQGSQGLQQLELDSVGREGNRSSRVRRSSWDSSSRCDSRVCSRRKVLVFLLLVSEAGE